MAVLFMLFTFLAFVLLDWWFGPAEAPVASVPERQARQGAASNKVRKDRGRQELGERHVEGFLVPERFQFHAGHAWVLRERRNLVRVGLDDFAARIAGKIEKIELPKPGTWIRQGQKAWSLTRAGETATMVSPTEGEVVEVNEDLLKDPSLLRKAPYDRGWLMTVHVPDEEGTMRNLLPSNLVPGWISDAAKRLYAHQPELAGAVAADAGQPVEDIAGALPHVKWSDLTGEFFLTR